MATREAVIRVRLEDGDALTALGELTLAIKKDASELKTLNKEIEANGKATTDQKKRIGELTATLEGNRVKLREMKGDLSGAKDAGLRFRDVMTDAVKKGLEPSFEALTRQIRESKKAAQEAFLTFGKGSDEFRKAAAKVDDLQDTLKEVNVVIDTIDFDGKVQAFGKLAQGVAGGFAVAQGAMALLGTESQNVEKALLKVQAAIAISQGITGLIEASKLAKGFAISIGLVTTAQEGAKAATIGTTLATEGQTVATGGATIATRVLGAAMNALPLIAIVSAIGTLIAAWSLYSDEAEAVVKSNEDVARSIDDINSRNSGLIDFVEKEALANLELRKIRAGRTEDTKADIEERLRIEEQGVGRRKEQLDKSIAQEQEAYDKSMELAKTATGDNLKTATANQELAWSRLQKFSADKEALENEAAAKEKQGLVDLATFAFNQEKDRNKKIEDERKRHLKELPDISKVKFQAADTGDNVPPPIPGVPTPEELAAAQARMDEFDANRIKSQQELYSALEAQELKNAQIMAEAERQKEEAIQSFGDAFTAVGAQLAAGSAAQKALAVSSALINTYLGVTRVLSNPSVLPEPAATAQKVVSIAGVLATGLGAVSKIAGFAEGGYTGPGGKHEPAGVVHRGEYVLPQGVVNTIGVPALDQLVNALSGRPTQSGSSYAAGGAVRGTALVNMRGNDILSDPSILAQVRQSAALSAFASQPIYTSWVEGQAVGRRVQIIEQRSSI